MRDAIASFDLLKLGGMIIFDDYQLNARLPIYELPTRAIDDFIEFNFNEIEVLQKGYRVYIKKVAQKCSITGKEMGNMGTPIGKYCYYWNHYQLPGLSKGLYAKDKKRIPLSVSEEYKLQELLLKHTQQVISANALFSKSQRELKKFLSCAKCEFIP